MQETQPGWARGLPLALFVSRMVETLWGWQLISWQKSPMAKFKSGLCQLGGPGPLEAPGAPASLPEAGLVVTYKVCAGGMPNSGLPCSAPTRTSPGRSGYWPHFADEEMKTERFCGK